MFTKFREGEGLTYDILLGSLVEVVVVITNMAIYDKVA